MYAYVGGDPVNGVDPSGMAEDEIIVQAKKLIDNVAGANSLGGSVGTGSITRVERLDGSDPAEDLTITAKKPKCGLWCTFKRIVGIDGKNPYCASGVRGTVGYQASATGFLASMGVTGSLEVGIATPIPTSTTWNPYASSQLYVKASGLGLAGLGFFSGAGTSAVGGFNNGPIETGVQTTIVAQGGFAWEGGGELQISTDGSGGSVSGGARAGAGAYLAGGAGKSATFATPQLGCP
jgi:hypothetical protein